MYEPHPLAVAALQARSVAARAPLARAASEEPGMRVCAEWIKTVVKEVPAKWIGAGDPYWRPTV